MNQLINKVKMLEFPKFVERDEDGKWGRNFIAITDSESIPFEIKRIFYIYGVESKELVRGKHANRKSEFVLFNISGSSKVRIISEDSRMEVYTLDRPNVGLYLPHMIWKEMYEFSEDSVMMVLSSEGYDAEEYIRNFDEFVHEVHAMRHGKYKNREKRKQTVKWRRKEPCKLSTPS